jgi:hypothetical protein
LAVHIDSDQTLFSRFPHWLQKFATRFKVAPQCGQVLVCDSKFGGCGGGAGLYVGSGCGGGAGL